MAYTPTVSVVVAAFNAEGTLEDCISSLLSLNYPKERLELIMVDDGSNDRTASILNRYRDRLRVFRDCRRGPAAARNRAVVNARGEVVAFTDSDCTVESGWLRALVAPLFNEKLGISGGRILSRRPSSDIETFGERIHDHEQAIRVDRPPYVVTMNWASRLAVLKQVNCFDEEFRRCEDVDLAYRISQAGYQFTYVPEAVVYHRNENTLTGLFREGFLHGYYSVQAIKKHKQFLKSAGHRKVGLSAYRRLASACSDHVRGKDRRHAACVLAFGSGKKVGKLSGSVRFRHLEL